MMKGATVAQQDACKLGRSTLLVQACSSPARAANLLTWWSVMRNDPSPSTTSMSLLADSVPSSSTSPALKCATLANLRDCKHGSTAILLPGRAGDASEGQVWALENHPPAAGLQPLFEGAAQYRSQSTPFTSSPAKRLPPVKLASLNSSLNMPARR